MITAPDAEHMRLRRLANPAFLNSASLLAARMLRTVANCIVQGVLEVEPVLQEYTELLCSQLTEASVEGSQNMVEWLLWTLNDVIGES